jgi:U3 small nucleolar RNA-associated protein 6
LGRCLSRALQKHSSSAELWILAAQYEYEQNFNISGARNLLQLSLRLNPEKRKLWLEYAKLECLYILKIMERRRILGLDHTKEEVTEDRGEFEGNEILLPTITQNELQTDVRFDPLLVSPLTDVTKNPALTGAIPMAVYSSAITSRFDDISLAAGFYDVFAPFHSKLSFIDSSLATVKNHLEEVFRGRGKTLVVQVKYHARGITPLDKRFPGALREMMKTASVVDTIPVREQKEFREGLKMYLEEVLQMDGLDESLEKVIKIFYERIVSLK